MWCWIVENSEAIRVVLLFFGLLGGSIGLCFAGWRCRIADRNLLRARCQMGMELFSLNPEHYSNRAAGATILSDILNNNATEYDSNILRTFEAFLFAPPGFGMNLGKHERGDTDYESRDTFVVVTALRKYAKRPDAQPMLSLPPGLAFTITQNTVEPNKDHEHYKRWIEARGGPPEYSD